MPKIYPRCRADMAGTYVNSDGQVLPCCWLGSDVHYQQYLEFYKNSADELNLKNKDFNSIVSNEAFKKIEQTWDSDHPLPPCIHFCSKPIEKNTNMQGTNVKEVILLD